MLWYEKYLGIPFQCNRYDFNSCDCGGLVMLVLKNELNIELPRLDDCVKFNSKEKHEAFQEYLQFFEEVPFEDIMPFDMFFQLANENVFHCGIFVDKNRILQAVMGRGVALSSSLGLQGSKIYRCKLCSQ